MSNAHMAVLPPELRQYIKGRCFDFALALQELLPGSELVAFGSARYPDHVAVRLTRSGLLIDVRGPLSLDAVVRGMQGEAAALAAGPIPVTVDQVALHIGQRAEGLRVPGDARKAAKERLAAFAGLIADAQSENPTGDTLDAEGCAARPRS